MSGFEHWMPALDPATGTFILPLWAAGALAALIVAFCLLAFGRAGREDMIGTLGRITLVLVGAVAAWAFLDRTPGRDARDQRQTFDARIAELTARALTPGSSLACLDAMAGETVETSCEKALFATPETTASAVSYVAAQLALLADGTAYARRADPSYEAMLTGLRHAVETDRFGIVAHVLSVRDGCTPEQCSTFALLNDPTRVSNNLSEVAYDLHVAHHIGAWPTAPITPVTALSPNLPPTAAHASGGLFLPSSSSIPAVSIMNAEPAASPQQQAAVDPAAKPAVPRKPPARRVSAPTNITPVVPRAAETAADQ